MTLIVLYILYTLCLKYKLLIAVFTNLVSRGFVGRRRPRRSFYFVPLGADVGGV